MSDIFDKLIGDKEKHSFKNTGDVEDIENVDDFVAEIQKSENAEISDNNDLHQEIDIDMDDEEEERQNISEAKAWANLSGILRQKRNQKAICAVAGCPNPSGIAYHVFPRDQHYRKIWLQKIGKPPHDPNSKTIKICATHFTKEDYYTNFTRTRTSLKKNAVPSVYVHSDFLDYQSELKFRKNLHFHRTKTHFLTFSKVLKHIF